METHIKMKTWFVILKYKKIAKLKKVLNEKMFVFNNITVHYIYCNNDIYFLSKRWQIDICDISLLLNNVNFVAIGIVENHDTTETNKITNVSMECVQSGEDGSNKHIWN